MHTHLERRVPAKNMARFYRMLVLPNLFGEWSLHREWGRIGRGGQTRIALFAGKGEAIEAMRLLEKAKFKKGYFADGPGEP